MPILRQQFWQFSYSTARLSRRKQTTYQLDPIKTSKDMVPFSHNFVIASKQVSPFSPHHLLPSLVASLSKSTSPQIKVSAHIIKSQLTIINFNIKSMKKIRPQKSQPQAITLSSKRGSLNQEQLFVPYKIDWKNSPLQNVENSSSKAFFQNMKAELSNIKNDFEKLIKKEGPGNSEEDYNKSLGKPKCQSAYKKEVKKVMFDRYPENEKIEIVKNNREESDHYFKILNLERNLPCTSNSDFRNTCSKTVNLKDNIVKECKNTSPFETIDLQRNRVQSSRGVQKTADNSKLEEKDKEIGYLKETITSIQAQLRDTKEERDFTKNEAQKLFGEKNALIAKMTELSNQLGFKVDLVMQQDAKLKRQSQDMQRYEHQLQEKCQAEQQFCNERNFYTDKINELMFHNQNLGGINMDLGNENQMLKDNLSNLERYVEELKRHLSDVDADGKRKLEYLQRELQEYQKREDMFSKEIERLSNELRNIPPNTPCVPTSLTENEELLELRDQVFHLTKQVAIQKEIHEALSKKYEEQIASLRIEELSRSFEEKVNKLVDENCKLKTRINYCESSLESVSEQNQSYLMQISLYEEREKQMNQHRQLTPSEWEELNDQIDQLKEENKRLTEELEYKNLKQETEKEDIQFPTVNCDSLVRMANMQLFENEKLKETIKELSSALKAAEQKVESLKTTLTKVNESSALKEGPTEVAKLSRRHEEIYCELQAKNSKIASLKEVIFKVLIEKASKVQEQEDLEYYLKEIHSLKQAIL